jgi:uncharacterized membrane protein YoaT (DUF817 family)
MQNKASKIRRSVKNLIFNCVFIIFNLLFIVFFYKNIILTTILLVLLTVLFLFYYKSKILIPIFCFASLGAILEMFAVYSGAWSYSFPDIFNVPVWLFVIWGNVGLLIYRVGLEFQNIASLIFSR